MGDEHIGARVRRIRLWRAMTQAQVAGLAGWSTSAVSMLETGATGLDSRTRLAQLAEALRVSPADLVGQPYPLDAPGLAEAQGYVPAVGQALMDHRIGDRGEAEPAPLADLETLLTGRLLDANRLRADDAERLSLLPDLLIDLQAYGRDERALRLLSLACAEATYALRYVGQVPLAWIAAERCAQAAEMVGDPVLIAAAEFTRAHSRPAGPVWARAGEAADQMPDDLIAGDDWAREVYGMLRLTAALAAQVHGDSAGAVGQVEEAAKIAQAHGERPAPWEYFGPANVGTWRTMLAVEAGEPARALEHAAAVDLGALKRERTAALYVDVARAHHQLGRDHDRQAVAALRQAEKLSPVRLRASPWARDLVEVMLTRSRREAGGRELRGLAYRMGLEAV
jgi:transcriptional regulator with XRE-family HTH domain